MSRGWKELSLALFAVVIAAGCARTHLFYDTREIRHEPLDKGQRTALIDVLDGRLSGRTLTFVDAEGAERTVPTDRSGLSELGIAELGALWLATATGDVGAENDLRVQLKGKPPRPVSVLTGLDGNIVLMSGGAMNDDAKGATLDERAIRQRFGLRGKLRGKWGAAERRALTASLASLQPAELDAVRDVDFERQSRSADGDPTRAALYEAQGCHAVIYLFSTGVLTDRYRFVGDPRSPQSATLHSIVHEVGHAFEHAPARDRYCRAEKASGRQRNRLIREGNAIMSVSLVLSAYLDVLGDQPAPTDYGNKSPHESFAESFALFRVDPAALRRTRPAVHAWFAAGSHLEHEPGG